jgi:Bacterial Ig domain
MSHAVDMRRLAGTLALVALACGTGNITAPGGGSGPPPPPNHDPEITVAPGATTTQFAEGGTTLLSVTAEDPDGDSLGYAWTQISPASPLGTFSSRTVRNPTWTAPAVAADTVFTFSVSITDGQGGSASQTCQVTVTHLTVNRPPVVSATIMVSPAMPVAGEVITLSITATDPDGDPLTISWTQTAPVLQGTFGTPTNASTTWFSPVLSVDALSFSFQVTVSDGHNPAVQRQVTVPVQTPSYGGNVQKIWDAQCMPCHDASQAAMSGQLDLTAGTSYGALVGQAMVKTCSDSTRVVAGDPSTSGLIDRLTGNSCGSQMPEGANPLSAADLTLIQSWIADGAQNN